MDRGFQQGVQFSAMEMANKMQQQLEQASSVHSLNNMLKRVKGLNLEEQLAGLKTTEDTLKKFLQSSLQNDNVLSNATNGAMKEFANLAVQQASVLGESTPALSRTGAIEATLIAYESSRQFMSIKEHINDNQGSVMSKAADALNQFSSLASFEALSGLKNFPLNEILATNVTTSDIEDLSESSLAEIDAELSDEIKSGKDFSSYSEKAKKILYLFCTFILLPYFIGIASSISANHIQQFQEISKNLETSREVKSLIRSDSSVVDLQALKGHRVTTVNNLNFRDNFGMNSTIIDTLPIGTVVRVIDKSNKSWLMVEVKIDGEFEQGWVLRRYTTYFK